jgi:hypothetical protein
MMKMCDSDLSGGVNSSGAGASADLYLVLYEWFPSRGSTWKSNFIYGVIRWQ